MTLVTIGKAVRRHKHWMRLPNIFCVCYCCVCVCLCSICFKVSISADSPHTFISLNQWQIAERKSQRCSFDKQLKMKRSKVANLFKVEWKVSTVITDFPCPMAGDKSVWHFYQHMNWNVALQFQSNQITRMDKHATCKDNFKCGVQMFMQSHSDCAIII